MCGVGVLRVRGVRLVLAVGMFVYGVASLTAPAAEPVLAGVAKVDITPDQPVRMYGYGARKTESEGIAGRLKAAALPASL